jgi:hypothetical protein
MISGLAITPPVVGRISIGRVVERNGKRLPEKDDQFTITTQVQTNEGWVRHPIDEVLRENSQNGKLRAIPVRLPFSAPDLNFRAEYSCFDRTNGRPMCVGNGDQCKRFDKGDINVGQCPSPMFCELAKTYGCKPYGRLNVQVGDESDISTFIFRTTGFNSIRTISSRLLYYRALSNDLLPCLPLELRIRGKSTTQSYRTAIYYVDLIIREGFSIKDALAEAKQLNQDRIDFGFRQDKLDQAAREGFAYSAFEFDEEEMPEIMEEFYVKEEALYIEGDKKTKINKEIGQNADYNLGEKLNRQLIKSQ